MVALLGVLKAGGAYLPLDPDNPPDRLRFQVADAGARHMVTVAALADGVSVKTTRLDANRDVVIAARPATPPIAAAEPHNLAYCLYTSGSTGTPKGVLHRTPERDPAAG